MDDVKKGLEIDPTNKALKELQVTLKKDMKDYVSTSKKVYGKMMEKEDHKVKQTHHHHAHVEEPKVVEIDLEDDEEQSNSPDEAKVVEIMDHPVHQKINEVPIKHSNLIETEKAESNDEKYDKLIAKVERLEKVVEEVKFAMDILKGFGAIPYKMPTEEEKKEVEERQKQLDESRKLRREPIQNKRDKWMLDD